MKCMPVFSMYYMSHGYVYSSNIATLSCSRSKRNAAAAEEEGAACCCGACQAAGLPGRLPWVAKPAWRICCMSLRAMKSVNNPVVVGLAGMACNPASWNGSGRNMHKYAKNVQLYVKDMHKIWKYIDCISQICKRFARQWWNIPEICLNMHIVYGYMPSICSYMHQICTKYANI